MQGSKQRIECVLNGRKPDRMPIFDLVPNDAVLKYFNGNQPVDPGDDESAIKALDKALDATRYTYFSPMLDKMETLETGQTRKYERWTIWTSHIEYASSENFMAVKQRDISDYYANHDKSIQIENDLFYRKQLQINGMFGEDFYFLLAVPTPGFMGMYMDIGLEAFSYFLCDCEDLIANLLEMNTDYACRWAQALPPDDPFQMVFIGEDMAFNHGPMVSPVWLKKHYFPKLRRVVDAYHASGKKVMFHSDGNLNLVMDDLVETGIDVLNPIEVAAGMELADLHKRYPHLVYAGGIDVSHLLPFGSTEDVHDAVLKAIEDTDGQVLIGSSTEVHDSVPLKNYLAMRQTAIDYKL